MSIAEWARIGVVFDAASGVLYLALGVLVLLVRPWRRDTVAFGVFALGFGLRYVMDNLSTAPLDALGAWGTWVGLVGLLVTAPALLVLAWWFPTPLSMHERRLVWLPIVVAGVFAVAAGATVAGAAGAAASEAELVRRITINLRDTAVVFLLVLLVRRHDAAARAADRRTMAQVVLVTWALIPFSGLRVGLDLQRLAVGHALPDTGAAPGIHWIAMFGALVCVAALWLVESGRAAGIKRRRLRGLALAILGAPLAGFALGMAAGPVHGPNLGVLGLARTAGVVVFAYAILRHKIFGIDVRVKWTIRQSTLAAIFVAVFFVVSETAQQVFSATRLGAYLGIAAAGLLLFALHPLQRMAERVADKAMPGVRAVGTMSATERVDAYRRQVQAAWADGAISGDERRLLDAAREALAIDAETAFRIERESAP